MAVAYGRFSPMYIPRDAGGGARPVEALVRQRHLDRLGVDGPHLLVRESITVLSTSQSEPANSQEPSPDTHKPPQPSPSLFHSHLPPRLPRHRPGHARQRHDRPRVQVTKHQHDRVRRQHRLQQARAHARRRVHRGDWWWWWARAGAPDASAPGGGGGRCCCRSSGTPGGPAPAAPTSHGGRNLPASVWVR